MNALVDRRTVTVAVRIWTEYLQQDPPSWHGEVEQVSNGRVSRFGDLETMIAILARCAGLKEDTKLEERHAQA